MLPLSRSCELTEWGLSCSKVLLGIIKMKRGTGWPIYAVAMGSMYGISRP